MELKFVEVVSVSSEDPKHPAEALLRNEKWLSAPGSKCSHVEVVMTLNETSSIGSIHIGNCGSAYISVLVAKKGSSAFTSLLPQSTFMSVMDCKLSKNTTKIRMFDQRDFLPEARDDTWSQVKLLCSQPFNMFMQYGVSFIRVFSAAGMHLEGKNTSPGSWQAFKRLSNQQVKGDNVRSNNTGGLLSRSERLILQSAKSLRSPNRMDFLSKSPQRRLSVSPTNEAPASEEGASVEEDDDVFEVKVVSFLETLELHRKSLQNIELGHVTKEFETALGRQLTVEKKKNFTEILCTHLKSLKSLQTEQSPRSKCVPTNSSLQCKSPASQQSHQRGGAPRDTESTPRKIVVKGCSPGWVSNMIKPGASDKNIEEQASDGPVTPVKCSSTGRTPCKGVLVGGEGLSGGSRTSGLSPRKRRNIVSLEDVEDDAAGLPSRSKLLSPPSERLKGLLHSPGIVTENIQKKQRSSVDTDDCVIVSSTMRDEDSMADLLIQCPICSKYFESSEIQTHAERCETYVETDIGNNFVNCPLCSKKINKDEARSHADSCARLMFGD